ncbi:MAG TPA: oxygenase MpaB family protein [Cyclobacteriaceae bacterium]|nr:DUF2236 domain-containing protein [Cyclobacteriaceae bacterium]HMV10988.1 oxygenase MpaB family protein [Cyclobacteriaceae bacterium]HMV91039.1 oxygenase MpaB family protein [Cyclobacteriaceae bacterium]HMX01847.1 oxygenase MpaB family protein [Cyclobacteriaceae bacterium]HMX50771.1 oxygenase MpaB family protein [Cyclobacteriaceae bacterium]
MGYFVNPNSIVRKIWGKSDTILFIFAASAAEFALNKAVDWLYFTGRLPADPIGRLFSTVAYARTIVFSEQEDALRAIDAMSAIHAQVEAKRQAQIPDWAYRDVLSMLIDYSIRSFELLERKLTSAEKQEIFTVFSLVGHRMKLAGLPNSFVEWELMRHAQLQTNLQYSTFTEDLFSQYKKHLGWFRFTILLEAQALMAPPAVAQNLTLRKTFGIHVVIALYKLTRLVRADRVIKTLLLPSRYRKQILALDKST